MAGLTELNEIGLKYGTDKASTEHNFLTFYEERLTHLRNQKFLMVEIGVLSGGSLRTWSEFFPQAVIVGMDINPGVEQFAGGNRRIFIGDSSDPDTLKRLIAEHGRPLVVLDDGSHIWDHQITALQTFWPEILPGGMFIMEDLHTSMWGVIKANPAFIGQSDISTYDYIQTINKRLVGQHFVTDARGEDTFMRNHVASIRTIEWYPRTCIIRKNP